MILRICQGMKKICDCILIAADAILKPDSHRKNLRSVPTSGMPEAGSSNKRLLSKTALLISN